MPEWAIWNAVQLARVLKYPIQAPQQIGVSRLTDQDIPVFRAQVSCARRIIQDGYEQCQDITPRLRADQIGRLLRPDCCSDT